MAARPGITPPIFPPDNKAQDSLAARIRDFDWSATPLGPIESWPQSLRTVVNILLTSRYAMWMGWGAELTFLFNDAYRPTLGLKDPWALGARADRVWAEIWPDIGPRIERVLESGNATYDEGLLLILERSGFPEETYHTFSYSPLADDAGRVSGMLCVVTEETERLIGERRLETLRSLATALAAAKTEDDVLGAVDRQPGANRKDLPFTLTYLFDGAGHARLASAGGIERGHPLAPAEIENDNVSPWPVKSVYEHPEPRLIENLAQWGDLPTMPLAGWNKPVTQAEIVPIGQQGQEAPAGFLVAGLNPYRRHDAGYRGFVELLGGQIAAALSNARAHEAERRRAEALAEIDRAKTTFFSNVSHELRTPLTLMLSPVEELLARGDAAADPAERQQLELIHRNGLRLQRLVNSLLDFSRIEAGRVEAVREPTDLPAYTAELAANFRSAMEKAGLEFRVECEPLPAPAYVDREMWEKIVLNLLSNALKFTLAGSVTVSLKAEGRNAVLTVADTGIGMPAAELPHVFERFHRVAGARGRSIEGTGIGLALVHELVKLHGGSVSVESEPDRGSTFHVRIPLGPAPIPKEKARTQMSSTALGAEIFVEESLRWLGDGSAEAAPSRKTGRARTLAGPSAERVLVADDNADMREYIARLLGERYRVTTVSNGRDALLSAVSDPPDLILSDVMMPELNGVALLQELRNRAETKTIPVVLVSARAGEESRVEGLNSGADDYLIKPFTARELMARVAAHLSMNRRRREAEDALAQSQATLQSFYDSSPFLMGVVEIRAGEIFAVYANKATANFFGIPANDVSAHDSRTLSVPRAIIDLCIEKYEQSRVEGRAVSFEFAYPNGAWFNSTVNYLGDGPTGQPRYSFVTADITERKKQEDLLRRSNDELRRANADLEQFAYSASHDLQEPLRQVAIYSEILKKKYAEKLDGKASLYLGYCIDGAHRMELLIRDLLAYSQVTRTVDAQPESVDTNEVIDAVRKNLAAAIRETGAEIVSFGLPVVRANRVPLTHVFQNLISNALKYRGAETPQVKIWAERQEEGWLFSVQDNGIGIAGQYHDQIFGLFKRLHDRNEYPGTGIGLAICQKVLERYGGRIWVESEEGRGSTFRFILPL